jgi:integrase
MRGDGGLHKRAGSKFWYAHYSRNGNPIQESTGTDDKKKAMKFLRQRLEAAKKPTFVDPIREKKLDLDDLEQKILSDYQRHARRSAETVKHCLKPVKEYFEYDRLLEITPPRIEGYQTDMLAKGYARASVNRQVRYLLHGYRLLFDVGEISYLPKVKLLSDENVREGFVNRPDFEGICEELKENRRVHSAVEDIIRFTYLSAWRSGEAKNLTWDKYDPHGFVFRLPRRSTKNKRPRTLVLVGELKEIIERRLADRRPDCNFVFHRNGKPIKSYRGAFTRAASGAGLDLVPHDLRRSGVRNLRRAGNDERDCMEVSGHETRAIFDRYDICDEEDQRRALERLDEQQKIDKAEPRKVIPIRQVSNS